MEEIEKEDNISTENEREIICWLWHTKDKLNQKLKEWELDLSELEVDCSSIKEGLKVRNLQVLAFRCDYMQQPKKHSCFGKIQMWCLFP